MVRAERQPAVRSLRGMELGRDVPRRRRATTWVSEREWKRREATRWPSHGSAVRSDPAPKWTAMWTAVTDAGDSNGAHRRPLDDAPPSLRDEGHIDPTSPLVRVDHSDANDLAHLVGTHPR